MVAPWLVVAALATTTGPAWSAQPDAPPSDDAPASPADAATLLSRYPAGGIPDSPAVLQAIATLSRDGDRDDVPVLLALANDETGVVRQAAREGLSDARSRLRHTQREAFASTVPDDARIQAWLAERGGSLDEAGAERLGRTEREMVAYAALVLGPLEAATAGAEARPDRLHDDALAAEDAGEPRRAIALHAAALAAGDATAWRDIAAFGVDPERLVLGLTATPEVSRIVALPTLPTAASHALADRGSVHTVAVMVERAGASDDDRRARALSTLGRMVHQPALPPGARAAARRTIDDAAWDPAEDR